MSGFEIDAKSTGFGWGNAEALLAASSLAYDNKDIAYSDII